MEKIELEKSRVKTPDGFGYLEKIVCFPFNRIIVKLDNGQIQAFEVWDVEWVKDASQP